jgi:hypothetical protein
MLILDVEFCCSDGTCAPARAAGSRWERMQAEGIAASTIGALDVDLTDLDTRRNVEAPGDQTLLVADRVAARGAEAHADVAVSGHRCHLLAGRIEVNFRYR